MTFDAPNPRTPEIVAKFREVLNGVATRRTLPERVQVMIKDSKDNGWGTRYVRFSSIEYSRESEDGRGKIPALLNHETIYSLPDGWTVGDNASKMLRDYPGVPLVLDRESFEELVHSPDTTSFMDEGNYRLIGRRDQAGLLEVYVQYDSDTITNGDGQIQFFR